MKNRRGGADAHVRAGPPGPAIAEPMDSAAGLQARSASWFFSRVGLRAHGKSHDIGSSETESLSLAESTGYT